MITGCNRIFEHEGRDFHIQVEDAGTGDSVEVRVYDKGAVLFVKRVSYATAIEGALEREDAIRAFMERTIQTVSAAIAKGKIA